MSLLLSSGMNPDQAAELLLELTESPRTKEKLKDLQRRMAEGTTFARALAESGLLPPAYTSMIAAGTKTGRVDEMMDLTARRLSEDIDLRLERRISLVEPAVVIIMCILIGAVLLSVMLPLILHDDIILGGNRMFTRRYKKILICAALLLLIAAAVFSCSQSVTKDRSGQAESGRKYDPQLCGPVLCAGRILTRNTAIPGR